MSATENHAAGIEETAAGELRLLDFESRIFRNSRTLRVWLPPGYNDAGNVLHLYPVLYLNDGQNLFDSSTAFAGVDWQVHKSAERLIAEGIIPPLIIVGIDHAQHDRLKEYVPYRAFNLQILRPLGERYPDFLVNE
ncbi:MAG: hypothetical protein JOY93_03390, partial [Acidobacteriales bacterium]|nr:hypothetical protein [Terriglobales bacterium]